MCGVDFIESMDQLGGINVLAILTHSIHEHYLFLHLLKSSILCIVFSIFFFLGLTLILLKFSLSMFFVLLYKILLKIKKNK